MTLKNTSSFEELAIEINGRFSELGIFDLTRAILVARWRRRSSPNLTSGLSPWLQRDLGISDARE
jgi:hypothetical protein